jgi:hypothetical protein
LSTLSRGDECISDLAFDEWLGGSLEPSSQRELQAHVERCVRCSLRCEVLSAQRAAFLERVPSFGTLAASVARSGAAPSVDAARWRWAWGAGATAAVAAGVALMLAFPRAERFSSVRNKGGPHIGAYVKRGERVARAESGDAVQGGDYVRFTYSSDAAVFFGLLNRDAHSAATYYPLQAQTVRVKAGNDIALDFSIKLDGEPGSERVHGLFCDEPQQLEPLRAALQATGRLPPLPHCRVDVLTLKKQKAAE